MNNSKDMDPVVSYFLSNWTAGTDPDERWFGKWKYDESMQAMYRIIRYLSMQQNVENLQRACDGSPIQKHSHHFIVESIFGDNPPGEAYEFLVEKSAEQVLGPSFKIDISKHAIISFPRCRKRKIRNSTMLMCIENPIHDFLKSPGKDGISMDLFLPWGLLVVSGDGNHRIMGAILSGVGELPVKAISRLYDFEPLIRLARTEYIERVALPFGKALYEVGKRMAKTADGYGHKSVDVTWLARY